MRSWLQGVPSRALRGAAAPSAVRAETELMCCRERGNRGVASLTRAFWLCSDEFRLWARRRRAWKRLRMTCTELSVKLFSEKDSSPTQVVRFHPANRSDRHQNSAKADFKLIGDWEKVPVKIGRGEIVEVQPVEEDSGKRRIRIEDIQSEVCVLMPVRFRAVVN